MIDDQDPTLYPMKIQKITTELGEKHPNSKCSFYKLPYPCAGIFFSLGLFLLLFLFWRTLKVSTVQNRFHRSLKQSVSQRARRETCEKEEMVKSCDKAECHLYAQHAQLITHFA